MCKLEAPDRDAQPGGPADSVGPVPQGCHTGVGEGDGGGAGPQTASSPFSHVQMAKECLSNMPPTAQIKCYQEQMSRFEGKRPQSNNQTKGLTPADLVNVSSPRLARGEGGHRMSARVDGLPCPGPPSPAAPAGNHLSGFTPSVCAVGLASALTASAPYPSALTASALPCLSCQSRSVLIARRGHHKPPPQASLPLPSHPLSLPLTAFILPPHHWCLSPEADLGLLCSRLLNPFSPPASGDTGSCQGTAGTGSGGGMCVPAGGLGLCVHVCSSLKARRVGSCIHRSRGLLVASSPLGDWKLCLSQLHVSISVRPTEKQKQTPWALETNGVNRRPCTGCPGVGRRGPTRNGPAKAGQRAGSLGCSFIPESLSTRTRAQVPAQLVRRVLLTGRCPEHPLGTQG